jgi:predicted transcriptional regulator
MLLSIEDAEKKLARGDNLINSIDLPSRRELAKFDASILTRKKRVPTIPDEIRQASAVAGLTLSYKESAEIFGISTSVVNRTISGYGRDNTRDDDLKDEVREKASELLAEVRVKATNKLERLLARIDDDMIENLSDKTLPGVLNAVSAAVARTQVKQVTANVNVDNSRRATFINPEQRTEASYESVTIDG